MFKFFYHMLLTANSIVLLIIIYIVKEKLFIQKLGELFSIILYTLLPITLTYLCIKLSSCLQNDRTNINIERIELANDAYLPSYLGYFFVALSIPDNNLFLLFVMYGIIFLLVSCSKSFYFNPVFFLFGYRFYQAKTESGLLLVLISKQEFRTPQSVSSITVYRINNFTFLEK